MKRERQPGAGQAPRMRTLARFAGPSGTISVLEDLATGARHYEEGGVSQSCVLAGGETGIDYVRVMASLLAGSADVLLLGCGGGALATMLHTRGAQVTVVDVNPISFQLARTFFWMPNRIACVTADMRAYMRMQTRTFDGIGIDVGGPRFRYERVIDSASIAGVRLALRDHGRIAINISCQTPDDPLPGRIAEKFSKQGLEAWVFVENTPDACEVNAVVLASARKEKPSELRAIAAESWLLARLGK